MAKILIVSSNEKSTELIKDLLGKKFLPSILTTKSAAETKRLIHCSDVDIIIINTPLSDEFGIELAEEITTISHSSIIMLVKNELANELKHKAGKFGVFVLAKPLVRSMFDQAIEMLSIVRQRIIQQKKENLILQNKIEELKLINRAKFVLMEYLNMNESAAHRHIEKQAMDMRISRHQIATEILKTYEI